MTTATTTDAAYLRFLRPAMATVFEVVFPFETHNAEPAAELAFALIDHLESQLTIYRNSSEVSRLNRIASQSPVPVESQLFNLLKFCNDLTIRTGGAFDITAGQLTRTWGFLERQGRMPSQADVAEAMAKVGMQHVALDESRRTVRFARPGVEINLGSIGKGYTLDCVGQMLVAAFGIRCGLLHAGTSSVLSLGNRKWRVGIKHPDGSRRLGTICLQGRALASSGATYQHFHHNGKRLGHLLDPRTGQPAADATLAVALAPTAGEADALATAFYVMGVEATREYCEKYPCVSAVLLEAVDENKPVVINFGDEWQPAGPNEVYCATTAID